VSNSRIAEPPRATDVREAEARPPDHAVEPRGISDRAVPTNSATVDHVTAVHNPVAASAYPDDHAEVSRISDSVAARAVSDGVTDTNNHEARSTVTRAGMLEEQPAEPSSQARELTPVKETTLQDIDICFEDSPENSRWKREVCIVSMDDLRSWRATLEEPEVEACPLDFSPERSPPSPEVPAAVLGTRAVLRSALR
jgi:hypothetical protein